MPVQSLQAVRASRAFAVSRKPEIDHLPIKRGAVNSERDRSSRSVPSVTFKRGKDGFAFAIAD
jgi:hypothetical protein